MITPKQREEIDAVFDSGIDSFDSGINFLSDSSVNFLSDSSINLLFDFSINFLFDSSFKMVGRTAEANTVFRC